MHQSSECSAKIGKSKKQLALLAALIAFGLNSVLKNLWMAIFPFFVNELFGTLLGEEFLFRGVSLPRWYVPTNVKVR